MFPNLVVSNTVSLSTQAHELRRQARLIVLSEHPELFDRFTKDKTGGRVCWNSRKPHDWDTHLCGPWSSVRGRYWYPWK